MHDQLERLLTPFEEYEPRESFDFPARWLEPLETLLAFVTDVEPEQAARWFADHPESADLIPGLSHLYARYIRSRELVEIRTRLSDADHGDGAALEGMGEFARRAYDRVRDMFETVDFSGCRRFVMVGCGSLPVTMLHVMEKTTVPEIVGLDIDGTALSLNQTAIRSFDSGRLRVEHANGTAYDYESADIVYIANLVQPKRGVLKRVADTARDETQVILRDPYSMGRLFAESGVDELDERLRLTGEGAGSRRFLSRHVFLRLHR